MIGKSERGFAPSSGSVALFIAGLGWGTTGLFVRALGSHGLSVYQLLIVRLIVTAIIITPIFFISLSRVPRKICWRPTLKVGLAMVFYYLGAITAFHNLQLVVAALIIGSSPLIAWCLPFLSKRRTPTRAEWKQGLGVAIAILGLLILVLERASGKPVSIAHETQAWLGLVGAVIAALITVFNARILRSLGSAAPKPYEVTFATVVFGLVLSPLFLNEFSIDIQRIASVATEHLWLCLGFGILATAVPGLAITYASTRLEPQATATVSIQLQVWSGVLAWLILGEAMSLWQILAAGFVVSGSWICLRRAV